LPMMCEIQWWDYHEPKPERETTAKPTEGQA